MGFSEAEHLLWSRIQQFSLDDESASFSFTQRLARDNNWGLAYADRVVTEYKKFMFLAACCNHAVTPSDQIDQAWHLHMIYTRSYWEEFCGEVLKQPVHHGPTIGGKLERRKFVDWYQRTKQSYVEKFDEEPPIGIWPNSQERFDRNNNAFRVSSKDFWIIRKPGFSKLFSGDYLPIVGATVVPVALLAWSPYDLDGKSFLVFYAALAIAAVVLACVLRRLLTSDGSSAWARVDQQSALPVNHLAYLNGGQPLLLKSAVCELLVGGYAKSFRQLLQLETEKPRGGKLTKVATAIYSKLERSGSIDYGSIKSVARLPVAKISAELVKAGLVESRVKRHVVGWTCGVIMAGVLAVGIGRLIQAAGTGRPVGLLIFEMLVVVGAGAILIATVPFRTKTGRRIIAEEKQKFKTSKSSKPAPDSSANEVALMVGLFGTSVLAGTAFGGIDKELNQVLAAPISADGGGGDGGDGGCGGGCGGCGGCGG